jgi:hypothetical protein
MQTMPTRFVPRDASSAQCRHARKAELLHMNDAQITRKLFRLGIPLRLCALA